jgi:predicted dehydrogenase|tara:strand:+ start:263 stop:1216 length:954 start_codon:yes stop_codon:yes gene_type:complete
MNVFKIGIIGFGNIGKKRFLSILKIKKYDVKIVYVVDKKLNKKNITRNIKFINDWKKIRLINVDLIIVSAPTKISEKIVKELSGKYNLLVEKPITTNIKFMNSIVDKSNNNKKLLKTGYNLRFDDGLQVVKKIINNKKIGNIYYCKITYANGAAKTNTNEVGSLIDMAAHSLNLIQWFFENSKINPVYNVNQSNEFMNKTKIDNGFIILKVKKTICTIHHGFCTWKNKFDLEISGSKGYVNISSLSKWGNQKVSFGLRKYPSGIPIIKEWLFNRDNSWRNELIFVIKKILDKNFEYKFINNEGYNTLKLIKKLANVL